MDDLSTRLRKREERRKERIGQRDVIPSGVKSRNIADVVFRSDQAVATTTLSNGEQAIVTFELSQNDEFELIGLNYITVYVGTVTSANQLPGGSSIDESQWQVIGPFYDWANWNSTNFLAHKDYVQLYIRNISAGASQAITIYNRWKYISPRESS